jgi:hypothetical protein
MVQAIVELFAPPSTPVTPGAAIRWWEKRRVAYNVIVLAAALVSFVLFFVANLASGDLPPGEDAVEPLGLIAGTILFPVAINVCYTLGWLVEAPLRSLVRRPLRNLGPALFSTGLAFSLLVVTAPAAYWIGVLLGHLLRRIV